MSTSNFVEFVYDQNTLPDKSAFFGLYARLNYYNFEFATTFPSIKKSKVYKPCIVE